LALISFGHELVTSIRFKIKKSRPLQSYYREQAEVTIHAILITNTTKNMHKVKATTTYNITIITKCCYSLNFFIDAIVPSEETLIDYYTDLFCGSKDKIEHNRKRGKHVEH
jgi:hypothetical protein